MAKVNVTLIKKPTVEITRTEIINLGNTFFLARAYPKHYKGKAKRLGVYGSRRSAQRAIQKYRQSVAA